MGRFGMVVWSLVLVMSAAHVGCSSDTKKEPAKDVVADQQQADTAGDARQDGRTEDQGGDGHGGDGLAGDTTPDGNGGDAADVKGDSTDVGDAGTDTQTFTCETSEPAQPTTDFFVDVSATSGVRAGNYVTQPTVNIPINDHSRLGFADINGDGFDDVVAHSLYPNPQAGIPFDHVVLLNNGDGTFKDFSQESGLKAIQAGFFAFGDVDNDGDADCFAGADVDVAGADHALLLNDGQGHFTPVANSGLQVPYIPLAAGNAVFADFNGDAKLDLYVGMGHTNYAAKDQLFYGKGDGTFDKGTAFLVNNPQRPSNGTVICDFDNDGDQDIFVSTYGVSTELGANILWQNDGLGHFVNVAVEKGFAALPTGNYYLQSTGFGTAEEPAKRPGTYMGSNGFGLDCDDVDNDGDMDVFLAAISHPVDSDYSRKWSDPTQLLFNQGEVGGFAFINRFQELGLPFNEGDVDAAIIDFDNDGRMDLSLSRDNKYEPNYTEIDQLSWFGLMWQQATGSFQSVGYTSGINDPDGTYTASLTECTEDSQCTAPEACLFARCRMPCLTDSDCLASHETCIWLWNANIAAAQPFCRPLVAMKKAQNHAWSDVDHDGDVDLLVGGRDIGGGRPNFLFRNEIGHQNRWVALRLHGDGSMVNRDAIGARVQIRFADKTLTREVQASRGMYNSMDGLTLNFGLGAMPCQYTLWVRWPDGKTAEFPSQTFPESRYLRLEYPDKMSW